MKRLVNKISRFETTQRVQNWLTYAIDILKFKAENVPKAIFIPRQDVEDALNEFERNDEQRRKASGVRIYFTKKFPLSDQNDDLRIACVVVPTVMSNLRNKDTGRPIHNDAIITVPALTKSVGAALAMSPNGGGGGGGGDETIYDITSPCPTDCEGTTNWGG